MAREVEHALSQERQKYSPVSEDKQYQLWVSFGSTVSEFMLEGLEISGKRGENIRTSLNVVREEGRYGNERLFLPIPSQTCATYVQKYAGNIQNMRAKYFLNSGNVNGFLAWYDFAEGMNNNALAIDRAVGAIRNGPREEALNQFPTSNHKWQAYITELYEKYEELLKTDKTGVRVMEYSTLRLLTDKYNLRKGIPSGLDGKAKEFYTMGAFFALEFYKKVYPIEEELRASLPTTDK